MNTRPVCKDCGGANVSCKARMIWAPFYQKFLVEDFIDDSWECEDCGGVDVEQVEYTGATEK